MSKKLNGLALTAAGLCAGLSGLQTAHADIIAQFDFFSAPGSTYIQPFYPNYFIDQTFTTTQAGIVNSVDMTITSVTENNPQNLPLDVSIQPLTTGGLNGPQPTGTILSSGSIGYNDSQFGSPFIQYVNIPMTPTTLLAGQTYALVATVGTGPDTYPPEAYDWYSKSENDRNGNPIDLYPGGQEAISQDGITYGQQPNQDLPFRIGSVPEPTSLVLFGLVGLGLRRRARVGQN